MTKYADNMFNGCKNLTSINVPGWDITGATSYESMFYNCSSLTSLDLSSFTATSLATNMGTMFYGCKSLTYLNLSSFDTTNLTATNAMFRDCTSLKELDLTSFDTSKITNSKYMFESWTSSQKVYITSKWTLGTDFTPTFITTFSNIIAKYKFNQNTYADLIPTFNTDFTDYDIIDEIDTDSYTIRTIGNDSGVLPTSIQFGDKSSANSQTESLLEVIYLNMTEITGMSYTFTNCSNLKSVNGSNWNTINLTSINRIFNGCSALETVDFSNWNTSQLTTINTLFYNNTKLTNVNLTNWDTTSITTMYRMFYGCKNIVSLDLTSFNTEKVNSYNEMFYGWTSSQTVYVSSKWTLGTDFSPTFIVTFAYIIAKYKFNQNTNESFIPAFNTDFIDYTYNDEIDTDGYTIRTIGNDSGNLPTQIRFGDSSYTSREESLLNIYECNTSAITSMSYMFQNCRKLTSLDLSSFNTEKVTDMNYMFSTCSNLTSLDLSSFNTENVIGMNRMFYECLKLTSLNLSSFNTEKVTSMSRMFNNCKKLTSLDLSSFNTEKVTDMARMFYYCEELTSLNISSFNAQNVTDMSNMFYECSKLTSLDLSNFNTQKTTNMTYMFYNCENLTSLDLSSFNTQNVKNMSNMFYGCSNLTSLDVSNFNTEKVTDMNYMFYGCSRLTSLDLTNFDTQNVTSATTYMFTSWTSSQKVHISSKWTLGTDFTPTFIITFVHTIAKYKFDQNTYESFIPTFNEDFTDYVYNDEIDTDGYTIRTIGNDSSDLPTQIYFGTSSVETKSYSLLSVLECNTDNVTTMSYMFDNCKNLTSINLSTFNTQNVTDMGAMFRNCSSLTSLDLSNFNTNQVSVVGSMFYGCTNLTSLDLSSFNTENVTTTMYGMFYNCSNLTSLNLSGFNTQNVKNMSNMFYNCSKLTSLNLSSFNTENVTNMSDMFNNCYELTSLNLSNFNTQNVTNMSNMFNYCLGLTSLDLSSFNTENVTNMNYMFNGCSKLTSLDLSNFNTQKVTSKSYTFGGWTSAQTVYVEPPYWSIGTTTLNSNINWVVNITRSNGYWLDMTGITGDTTITMVNYNNLPTEDILTDWGDGTQNSELTHTYSTAGEYIIATNLQHNESLRPYTIKVNLYYNASLIGLFMGFAKLTEIILADNFITECNSRTQTSFERMFNGCWALSYLPSNFTKLNFSNVANVASMLNYSGLKEVDLTGWTTNNVKSWGNLFNSCKNLEKVNFGNVDFSENTSTNSMFIYCSKLTSENINFGNGWTTSNVTDMASMFNGCSSLTSLDLSSWNTSKVTTMNKMFWKCTSLTDCSFIESWDFSSMDNILDAFAYSGIKSFNFRNKTLNKLQYCATMLAYNTSLESVDFSGTTMTYNGGGIGNPTGIFDGCTNLKTAKFDNMTFIPKNCSNMFRNCSSLTSLDLSSWDTSQCTNLKEMFSTCSKLTNVKLDNWNTSKVTDMDGLFRQCSVLKNIDLSSFTTESKPYMPRIFMDVPVRMVDLSNIIYYDGMAMDMFRWNSGTTEDIVFGMLYTDAKTINKLVEEYWNGDNGLNPVIIYYHDADPSQLTPVEGVTFKKYSIPTTIQLPPHIQLHSLPDGTRDEVDIKTGILTRNVGCIVLDGTQTFVDNGNFLYISDLLPDYNGSAISNNEKLFITNTEIKGNNKNNGIYITDTGTLRIRTEEVYAGQSDTEFKKYLQSKPTTIYYSTSTPTTEQLILNYNNSCDYGRILPTGMCDKYDVVNSMYTQTMASILLDGENTWDAMEEMTNVVKFTATGTTVGVEELNMLGAGGLYCDNDLFPNINDDSDVEHCRVDETGNKFYIYISKDRLMSPDLIGYQIWLQENNFNLIYELAEHLTYVKPYEELDPTQARWEGMDCMRDGTINYHTNSSDNITIYPTLEYVAPSINNFEVTMLEPNTDYTIYAEGINTNDTINLGGTDINFNNGTVFTSGDNQWLRIDNNDSFYNMVITKGDTTGEVVPYFEGMTSVENPRVLSGCEGGNLINPDTCLINYSLNTTNGTVKSGSYMNNYFTTDFIEVKEGATYYRGTGAGELVFYDSNKNYISNCTTNPFTIPSGVKYIRTMGIISGLGVNQYVVMGDDTGYKPFKQSTVSYTDLKLRSLPNGVKDTINVVTGEYVQRVGEVVLDGSENWSLLGANQGIYSFSIQNTLTNVARPPQNSVNFICDKLLPYPYEKVASDIIQLYPYSNYDFIIKSTSIIDKQKFKEWLAQNPTTVQYELVEPIITKLDPQTLLAYTDGTINLSSDTGLLPTTHYTVPSTNTFNLPSMKTGTRYTLKYPSASGSITIGDINYSISSNSMLFTTPLKINGDTSAIIFSDTNPENVVLLEGAYNTREVPFFTGVKSVKNPNITIIDQLSTESTTYNCETEIELRGLPNGVADKLDIIKGKLTTNVGIRPYQEGDENLSNIWTDGYETVYALSSPVVTNVTIDHPTVTTNSLIELSSDYLIPQLNYRAPSSNNFPLDLLQSNATYTLYADTLVSGNYTLGGTKTGIYSQPHTITLGDMTDNLLTFNGDLGLSNVMLVKGNSLKTSLPPYFLGIRSVTDGHLLVEGMAGEMNEITFDEGIVLRDCNGVKDTIDLITCTLTKRTGEITLTGAEGWYRADNESTTDHNVFKLTLGGLKEALVMCDTLQSVFDTKMMDCIHAHTNELCIVIANATIGGDTVNALKSWLNQHPTTVVYQLRVPIEVQLENTWTTLPPTSYSNQTEISSTVSTNSLKPMISVTIATTTLEEIVSNLEAQNAELEAENMATMLALTSVYETMAAPMAASTMSLDNEPSTVNLSDGKDGNNINGMSVSPIGMVYVNLIRKGLKTIEQVPYNLQPEVMYALRGME